MADLHVDFLGKRLAGPVIAASGTFGFGPEYAGIEDLRVLGGISGKGLTLNGQPGNEGERLYETPSGLMNSIGLQNPGVQHFIDHELPAMRQCGTTVWANLGGHTIELTEKQKDPYREIILVQDNSSMEFLPDLKLNDSTGKTIADRAEESLDKVFTAAAAGKSFSTIKNEFSADTAVQKTAKEQYQQLCDAYLNSDTNTGITSITVSSVSTTVTSESKQMKIETNVTAAIERRTRFLHFFRKTKTETITWKIESAVTLEKETWVMGSDFLKGVDLGK